MSINFLLIASLPYFKIIGNFSRPNSAEGYIETENFLFERSIQYCACDSNTNKLEVTRLLLFKKRDRNTKTFKSKFLSQVLNIINVS